MLKDHPRVDIYLEIAANGLIDNMNISPLESMRKCFELILKPISWKVEKYIEE